MNLQMYYGLFLKCLKYICVWWVYVCMYIYSFKHHQHFLLVNVYQIQFFFSSFILINSIYVYISKNTNIIMLWVENKLFHGIPRKEFQGSPRRKFWCGKMIYLVMVASVPEFPMFHLCLSCHGKKYNHVFNKANIKASAQSFYFIVFGSPHSLLWS